MDIIVFSLLIVSMLSLIVNIKPSKYFLKYSENRGATGKINYQNNVIEIDLIADSINQCMTLFYDIDGDYQFSVIMNQYEYNPMLYQQLIDVKLREYVNMLKSYNSTKYDLICRIVK